MPDIPRLISQMRAKGLSSDAILAALEVIAEEDERRKAVSRASSAKYRNSKRKGDVTVTSPSRHGVSPDDTASTLLSTVENNLTPPPYNPPTPKPAKPKSDFPSDAFEQWIAVYPRRDAKGPARKAIEKLRAAGVVRWADLMDGTRRFARDPPDPKFTPMPATWLNQERWTDEPATHTTQSLFSRSERGGRDEDAYLAAARRDIAAMRDDPGDGIPGWHEGDGEPSLDLAASGGSYRTLFL